MNALHVVTKPHVISEELMFLPGEPVDSAAFAESERNLRNRFIFSELSIDTVRLEDGRLSAHVYTRDAFSTKPRLSFAVASDGRLTGQFGVTEVNLVGTGSMVKLWYVREEDRDGLDVAADFHKRVGTVSNRIRANQWKQVEFDADGALDLDCLFRHGLRL